MLEDFNPNRYAVINEKNLREIVMLVGQGCSWRGCRFCDYHLDYDKNENVTFRINKDVLSHVTGIHGKLEVINSGSFVDLDNKTMDLILKTCEDKNIQEVHFECHYIHRKEVKPLKERFLKKGIKVIVKTGVETFDYLFRESYLNKGIDAKTPEELAEFFDEVCLLQGIPGQSIDFMIKDIEIGLKYFKRVCINIMQENGKPIKPDKRVIKNFIDSIYPLYKDNQRVDILLENTAFGVGGSTTED